MFAIAEIGGKQYKVAKGAKLDVEKVEEKENNTFAIDKVILISEKGKTTIGTPTIEGAYVEAKVLAHKKAEKTLVFKMHAKKRYQRKKGHRQLLTTIEIIDIKESGYTPKVQQKKEFTAEQKPVAKKPTKPTAKKTTKKKTK